MALIGQISVMMTADTAKLTKGLKAAQSEIGAFASKMSSLANMAMGALIGAGGIAGIYKLVDAVGHMEQVTNRTKIVFGEFADEVINKSKTMADAFGTSRGEFLKGADAMGALFKNMGFTAGQAAELSVGFTKLAMDASRMTGIPVEEVMQKIRKGAAGSGRGLQELGVYMNDDVVHAEALRLGLVRVGQTMTESAKIQARLSVIQKGLADATGQSGAQADSILAKWDAFNNRIARIAETIGEILMPLIGPGGEMQVALVGIQSMLTGVADAMKGATDETLTGAEVQTQSIGMIQKSLQFLAIGWNAVQAAFKAVQSFVTMGIAKILQGVGMLAKGLDWLASKVGKDLGIGGYFDDLQKDLEKLSGEQMDQAADKLADVWNTKPVDDWFANARKKLADSRAEAEKTTVDLKKIGAPGTIVPEKKPEMHFAKAMGAGTQEAASTLLRSRYGGGKSNKELEKIAASGQASEKHLEKIANAVSKPGPDTEIWEDFGG